MTKDEKNRYRFSGYQLPKIQLDETGKTYYKVGVHPYYKYQPLYWQQDAFDYNTATINNRKSSIESGSGNGSGSAESNSNTNSNTNKLCCMLNFRV
jgi:hypothetical protein